MKIALSFYGQPRFLENTHIHESYRHYFTNRYDCDVFGHMWWKDNGNMMYHHGRELKKVLFIQKQLMSSVISTTLKS